MGDGEDRNGEGGSGMLPSTMDGSSGRDFKRALAGGAVAAAIAALGVGTTGVATGAEARLLLEAILPTIRFLTSSVITASATIMALMLTILGLSSSSESSFRSHHYNRIRRIGTWSTVAIIMGTVLLLFLSIPLGESEVLQGWYKPIFYAILVTSSVLGGIQVVVILLLQQTIGGLVGAVHPDESSPLTRDGEGH